MAISIHLGNWCKVATVTMAIIVVTLVTDIWVPLWTLPVIFWFIGLFAITFRTNSLNGQTVDPALRAKKLEKCVVSPDDRVNWNKIYVVKLCGYRFQSGFQLPFDQRFHDSMCRATADAVESFEASTGYIHGNRVYLIFALDGVPGSLKTLTNSVKTYLGAISSYVSTRLQIHLEQLMKKKNAIERDNNSILIENNESALDTCHHFFTGRMFSSDNSLELLNYMISESVTLTFVNSVEALAKVHFIPSEIRNISPKNMVRKLYREREVSYDHFPVGFKHGSFVKRVLSREKDDKTDTADNDRLTEEIKIRDVYSRPELLITPFRLDFKEQHEKFLLSHFMPKKDQMKPCDETNGHSTITNSKHQEDRPIIETEEHGRTNGIESEPQEFLPVNIETNGIRKREIKKN